MSNHTQRNDSLKLWEGMFGNSARASAGNYTIDYQEFTRRLDQYTQRLVLEGKIKEIVPFDLYTEAVRASTPLDVIEYVKRMARERKAELHSQLDKLNGESK